MRSYPEFLLKAVSHEEAAGFSTSASRQRHLQAMERGQAGRIFELGCDITTGGNAEGSTLRLSLGVLLEPVIHTELRRIGSGKRWTFSEKEQVLSEWMGEHTCVTWIEDPAPWVLEDQRSLIFWTFPSTWLAIAPTLSTQGCQP